MTVLNLAGVDTVCAGRDPDQPRLRPSRPLHLHLPNRYPSQLTPYTLYHIPYTPYPTPYSLHPTPYNLNPSPYNMHPETYSLHPARPPKVLVSLSLPPPSFSVFRLKCLCHGGSQRRAGDEHASLVSPPRMVTDRILLRTSIVFWVPSDQPSLGLGARPWHFRTWDTEISV